MYNNRQIRVQIREHNPPRQYFAFSRAATNAIAQRSQQQSRQRWPSSEQQRTAQLQAEPMRPPLHPRHSSSSAASVAVSPARSVSSTRPVSTAAPTPDPFVVNPQAQQQRAQSLPQAVGPVHTPGPQPPQQPPTSLVASQSQTLGRQQHPNGGYFVPHHYMMPPFAYPMPFAPYPGFVAPPPGPGHEGGTQPAGMMPGSQVYPFLYPLNSTILIAFAARVLSVSFPSRCTYCAFRGPPTFCGRTAIPRSKPNAAPNADFIRSGRTRPHACLLA